MTSTTVPPPARPVLHGLKALAGAQSALPATRTAAVTGGPLEYVRAGDGEPAVVLIGGCGLPIEGWALVLPRVVEISTVVGPCNRRGVGASAEPQRPQTGTVVADMSASCSTRSAWRRRTSSLDRGRAAGHGEPLGAAL